MNISPFSTWFSAVTLGLTAGIALAHDIPVHERITACAAQSARTSSAGYNDFITLIEHDLPYDGDVGVTNDLVKGSRFEDNVDLDFDGSQDAGGKRSFNHFYDPLSGLGLSNIPPDDRIAPLGNNSFVWASLLNSPGVNFHGVLGHGANVGKYNIWSWQNARDYEWQGLIAPDQNDRREALLNMFRAVGQVLHLLEDTTQPQHARNEQHLDKFWTGFNTPWRSPIEDYGADHETSLGSVQETTTSKATWISASIWAISSRRVSDRRPVGRGPWKATRLACPDSRVTQSCTDAPWRCDLHMVGVGPISVTLLNSPLSKPTC